MKNDAMNKNMAKIIIFSGYASMLDDSRLDIEYRQQCLIAKNLRESGITYFPLKDALGREIDLREGNLVG